MPHKKIYDKGKKMNFANKKWSVIKQGRGRYALIVKRLVNQHDATLRNDSKAGCLRYATLLGLKMRRGG